MKGREVIKGQYGNPNGYVEFLPAGYDGIKKFPMLTWWHGLGEPGPGTDSSLDRLQRNIVPWAYNNEVPFIILVPQDMNGWGKASPFAIWAEKYYQTIDHGSKHMAGLSSGGYMIRDFINEGSEVYKTYSTFTPMATNLDSAIPNVRRILENNQYVQVHAGENDGNANMVGASARFVAAGQKIAADRFELIVYDNIGHSAWEYVYNSAGIPKLEMVKDGKLVTSFEGAKLREWKAGDPTWWEWMLAHSKSTTPPVDPEPPVDTKDDIVSSYIDFGIAYFVTKSGKKYITPVTVTV